jgi:O-antigen/teichoic acid export membrane protein
MNVRLVRNVAWSVGSQLVLLALSLTLLRKVYRGVGGETVGLLYFSVLVGNLTAAVSEVGLAPALVREVSGRLGREPARAVRTLRTFSLVYWIAFAVLGVGLWLAAPRIAEDWLRGASASVDEIRLLGLGALLTLPRSLYLNMLRAAQRMDVTGRIEVAAAVLQQAVGLVCLSLGGGRRALLLWWSAAFAVGPLLAAWRARTVLPAGSLWPAWSPTVARENLGYTARSVLVGLVSLAQTHLDKLILSRLTPLGLLGAYGFGFGFVSRGTFFAQSVGQAALPALAERHTAEDLPALRALCRKMHDLVCLGSLAGFAAVPFLVVPLLAAVFDEAVARALHLPLSLLAFAFYLSTAGQALASVALAMGRIDIALRFNVYALLAIGPLTLLLVSRWGLVGAACSWIAYFALGLAYSLPRTVRECLGGRPREWYARLALMLGAGAAAYAPGLYLAARSGFAVRSSALGYAASSALFAAAGWSLLGREQREWVRALRRRAVAGVGGA